MKEFQWRLSHKALYTLPKLHEIDPQIPKSCTMCEKSDENLSHLFTQCVKTKQFWEWIFYQLSLNTELDKKFINNHNSLSKLHFYIAVLGKNTIWGVRNILRKSETRRNKQFEKLIFNTSFS